MVINGLLWKEHYEFQPLFKRYGKIKRAFYKYRHKFPLNFTRLHGTISPGFNAVIRFRDLLRLGKSSIIPFTETADDTLMQKIQIRHREIPWFWDGGITDFSIMAVALKDTRPAPLDNGGIEEKPRRQGHTTIIERLILVKGEQDGYSWVE
jgi:hypothetical protein